MKINVLKRSLWLVLLLFTFSSNVWADHYYDYQYVALNYRGIHDLPAHDELAQYLATSINKTIHTELIVPIAIVKRAILADLMLVNPVTAVKITAKHDFEIVATLNHRKVGPQFAGVIIVPIDSPIKNISDLANKVVAIIDKKNAAGGFLFQAQAMLTAGLNPAKDFNNFIVIPNQNAIVKRVIAKHVDAGFIRTGQLENFAKLGGDISQLRILNDISNKGENGRSTELYPHWAFLLRKSLPKKVKKQIIQALFAITADKHWLNENEIAGFVAVDQQGYERLRQVMGRLSLYH